jgi:predicted unusual protein kinase regulating ubiquinone biosynthesis (AarF/ABC1/UbiB family)/ribosomal protein L7/L12
MDHHTREQRRRETEVRLVQSHADIATSLLGRVPSLAATSMRGGLLALLVKLRQRPRTDSERESVQRIVASLGKLKGVAMKLGQHLSYFDTTLPDDVRAALAALQTHSAPMSAARVTKILRSELGDAASSILGSLEPTPLASASIGQVHRARLSDGTRVAVKVQYPGIASAIKADFGPASLAARLAAWRFSRSLASSQITSFLREAKACVLAECDYRAEARQQADFAARYAGHPVIVIPAVHASYCAERVIVTTYVEGRQLGAWLATDPSQDQRDAIGEALVSFYVGSALRWGVLPGDPHPGNYLVLADGRVAIVDHGCTRAFSASRAGLVLEADDEAAAQRGAAELGADALLLLRVRLGLASVLAQLGVRSSWRALVAKAMAAIATRFDVVLVAPGERMIEIVREVRDLMGANIRDAKELLEQTPCVLRTTSDRQEAEALKHRLEASGGIVEIRAS